MTQHGTRRIALHCVTLSRVLLSVYDLVWGDAETMHRARLELREYERAHSDDIQRNYARAAEDIRKLNAKRLAASYASVAAVNASASALAVALDGGGGGSAGSAAVPAPAPFVGPLPEKKCKAKAAAKESAPQSSEDHALKLRKALRKAAGGYLPVWDQMRCAQEALDSLLL